MHKGLENSKVHFTERVVSFMGSMKVALYSFLFPPLLIFLFAAEQVDRAEAAPPSSSSHLLVRWDLVTLGVGVLVLLVVVLTVSGVMAYHYREKQRERLRRCVVCVCVCVGGGPVGGTGTSDGGADCVWSGINRGRG